MFILLMSFRSAKEVLSVIPLEQEEPITNQVHTVT